VVVVVFSPTRLEKDVYVHFAATLLHKLNPLLVTKKLMQNIRVQLATTLSLQHARGGGDMGAAGGRVLGCWRIAALQSMSKLPILSYLPQQL
jgi:hypothetical protein